MTKEQNIEENFIKKLQDLKYIYRPDIRTIDALNANFKQKFEELNKVHLSESEFQRLLENIISKDVFIASGNLRKKHTLIRDDSTPLHYTLIDISSHDWCKNTFEVINQFNKTDPKYKHRYDVLILLNGLPLVQVELKTLQVSPRRAIEQIVNYKKDIKNGYTKTLLSFVQLFIVSNQTSTWYFANNNNEHFTFNADENFLPTCTYTDRTNRKITNLNEFCETFLKKCVLSETIGRYMVLLETEKKLLIMRPYQIYAVKAIVESIEQNCGNGYIWHTTGSGKTLTSFKASTLLKDNPNIEKCIFVVDRKDLDKQTREEFNKFQIDCVEHNSNTKELIKKLISTDIKDKIIVTTIQKLSLALGERLPNFDSIQKLKVFKELKEQLKPLRDKRLVFIFDECHRSQFGQSHQIIKDFFPNSQFFGFTGTPIFEDNAVKKQIQGKSASYMTTKDIFANELHSYTIGDAIDDKNVLKFHIDYFSKDDKVKLPLSKKAIVKAIIDKHDSATANRRFNAFFATSSIPDAIEYYELFKKMQAQKLNEDEGHEELNIACVFSPPNSTLNQDLSQENEDNIKNPNENKEALEGIIDEYNKKYKIIHSLSNFDLYYQDIQTRIKNQKYPNKDYAHDEKIDILIVVDMLLTGFDSKYLNTLYVDKNLKTHGLIQAFSRTNRILNDTKPYGNIINFRVSKIQIDEAIAMFSNKDKKEDKHIWLVDSASKVIKEYEEAVSVLENFMNSQGLSIKPEDVANLKGDEARRQYISKFKDIQKLKTRLDQYTDLSEEQKEIIEEIMPYDMLRSHKAQYIETAMRFKTKQNEPDSPMYDEDYELVLFASDIVDYDYIMGLIANYTFKSKKRNKTTKEQLISIISSDAKFAPELDIIKAYVDTLEIGSNLSIEEVKKGYEEFKNNLLKTQIAQIALKYELNSKALEDFIDKILEFMIFNPFTLNELFASQNLGWKTRRGKEKALMKELIPILHLKNNGHDIAGIEPYEE